MNYTFHQLRIFLEVVRHKSITRAAEEMHMTQPALSIQLKNFQAQFDIPLTEIIGKKLFITDFGRTIAQLAENTLNEAEAIKYKTKEYSNMLAGSLRIASASTGKYVIPYFLGDFMATYPGIDLTLDVSNKSTVIRHLQQNDVDFAFVSVLPEKIAVHEEILIENRLYLVGNSEKLDKTKPLIYREDGSATRQVMDNFYDHRSSRKGMKLTSNEAVKQAIIAGLGHSILPLIGIKNELSNKELHVIPTKGLPISTNWRLIWLRNKKLSPIAESFLNYIRSNKYQIIQEKFEWYLNHESPKKS